MPRSQGVNITSQNISGKLLLCQNIFNIGYTDIPQDNERGGVSGGVWRFSALVNFGHKVSLCTNGGLKTRNQMKARD